MKAFADAVGLTTLGAARDCPSVRVRLTPYRPALQAGGDGTRITSTVTNTGPTKVTRVSPRLDLPDGWSADPAGSVRIRSLAPGDSAPLTWTVTPTADAVWGTHEIGVRTSFVQDGRTRRDSDSVDATVTPTPSEVRAPYLTTATTTEQPQYAQNGDQLTGLLSWPEGVLRYGRTTAAAGFAQYRSGLYTFGVELEDKALHSVVLPKVSDGLPSGVPALHIFAMTVA